MIPKPPFERDLSLESEIADFERLKGRLRELWTAVFPADDQPYTSVVVPSVHETREPWSNYLEERLLFLLIRLQNPRARLVYVTSQPLHPLVVEYYLQLLFGVPASHALADSAALRLRPFRTAAGPEDPRAAAIARTHSCRHRGQDARVPERAAVDAIGAAARGAPGHTDERPEVTEDPRFEAPETAGAGIASVAGYRLEPGSPCAASGVVVSGNGGRDILGTPLPQGPPDRGAVQASPGGGR